MKRLFNVRLSLIAAFSFAIGIFAFYELLFGDFYFGLAAVVVLVVLLIVFAIKRNMGWKIALVALVFVLLGFGRSILFYQTDASDVLSQPTTLTGRVTDIGRNGAQGGKIYYLEDCSDENSRYGGRVAVYFDESASLNVGDNVTVGGNLSTAFPVKGDVNAFFLRNRIRYELRDAFVETAEKGKLNVGESVRKYIYDVTESYMPDNNGLMYALLTGDRNALDDGTQWTFGRAGISHLLAVSGLHVGFIAAVFVFVLKKFHWRPWLECLVIFLPLAFYAYLCNFTPSVIRAIVMLLCGYLSKTLLSRYDMLSAMAWAALIDLLVCPFYLFDIGFQLSFMSVFGIVALHAPLNRLLVRKNVNAHLRRLAGGVTVSLCCTASTLLVLACNGEQIAPFGMLLNVIAIPIVSVAFVLGLFGLIPWIFHYLLFASDALLQAVQFVSEKFAQTDFATFGVKATVLSVLIVIVLFFAVGGFIRLGKLGKRIFYPICCFLLVLSIVFAYIPRKTNASFYAVLSEKDAVVVALSQDGDAAILGDLSDYRAVQNAISRLEEYDVDALTLFIAHCSQTNPDAAKAIATHFDVRCVYLLNAEANDSVTKVFSQSGAEIVAQLPNSEVGNSVRVRSLYDGVLRAVCIRLDGLDLCVVYGDDKCAQSVWEMGLGADVYLLPKATATFAPSCTLTPCQTVLDGNYGANKYGNFTITQKGDKIHLSFR